MKERVARLWSAARAHAATWRVVVMFKGDRVLWWLTVAASVCVLFPMLLTPFLPLVNLGSHVGAAGLMDDILVGRHPVADRYGFNTSFVPYWTGYLLMGFFDLIGGPFFAAKATVAVVVLLVPLGTMRLLVALGRSPRLGLWAFIFAWDVNLYWGWFAFQLGMGLALWALAWLIEAQTFKAAAKVIPLTAAVALTQPHPIVLLGVAGLMLVPVRKQPLRALALHAVALSGGLILLPWALSRIFRGGSPGHVTFEGAAVVDKINALYNFSLHTLTSERGQSFTVFAFLVMLFGPLVVGAFDRSEPPERTSAMAVTIAASCLGLYLVLPFAMHGAIEHFWTYPRYGTYLLLSLLLLPSPSLVGRRALLLTPGLLALGLLTLERVRQFSDFGERTKPYLEIIAAMRPNTKFLPLDYESNWPGTREWPLGQLHGYTAAARSAYDPHLFDHDNEPVVFLPQNRPPEVDWWHMQQSFNMQNVGRFYDYIIVHPRSRDTQLVGADVDLIKEAGEWRLYAVRSPVAP